MVSCADADDSKWISRRDCIVSCGNDVFACLDGRIDDAAQVFTSLDLTNFMARHQLHPIDPRQHPASHDVGGENRRENHGSGSTHLRMTENTELSARINMVG